MISSGDVGGWRGDWGEEGLILSKYFLMLIEFVNVKENMIPGTQSNKAV